ncbi:MAG: hypothetical protein ABSD10_02765 [Candidatus Saccharimonadales bacterium]|jgi:hypothetical protein
MHKLRVVFKKAWQTSLWVFLILALASGSMSVLALRHNNQTMIRLRNELYVADKNDGNVNATLNNLRNYVYAHMNTNLSSGGNTIKPPIQLKYTYQRLVAAQQQQLDSANSQLYTEAENYCQQQDPTDFYGYYRVPCVQNYISTHSLNTSSTTIPVALYEFDFLSPAWSPDLAGWSLVVMALLALLFIAKLVATRLAK